MNYHTRFLILVLCLMLMLSAVPVNATETTESVPATTGVVRVPGQCGDTMMWEFANGVLTISGEGAMDDFQEGAAPWQGYSQQITEVVFKGNISYIGDNAFRDYDTLTTIDFGNAIYEIGKNAFRSCDGLTSIQLPYSFKVFGESSFENCKNLTQIHCKGRFPSFRQNSMWNTRTAIYYPADNPWDLKYIDQLESAFRGRITFLASDGTDPHGALETTEATETQPQPTEATIETTVPVETLPPVTVPVPSTTIPAATTNPTVPSTTAPAPTQEQESPPSARQIILAVTLSIAIVFTLMAVGILISQEMRRRRSRRRRRNR